MNKSIYFKNLDGLRFICFLLVFLYHSFYTTISSIESNSIFIFVNRFFENGHLGVNIFFVLSGFLITYLLLKELKSNTKIDVIKFWVRRVLRIWPLYYACVIFGFFIFPLLKTMLGGIPNEPASLIHYLVFLSNFNFMDVGADSSVLGVLWSVAIEEQFYLFWPLLFIIFKGGAKLLYSFILITIISCIYNLIQTDYNHFTFHTLACMGDLAIGGIFAYIFHENKKILSKFTTLNKSYFVVNTFCILVFIIFYNDIIEINSFSRMMARFLFSISIGIFIAELSFRENPCIAFSKSKVLSYLGRLTYGMYTLHFIGILITLNLSKLINLEENTFTVIVVNTAFSLIITIVLSYISFNYFEKIFLKIKKKKFSVTK